MTPAEVFVRLDAPGIAVVRALAMDAAERAGFSVEEIAALGDGVEESSTALADHCSEVRVVTSHEAHRTRIQWRAKGPPPGAEVIDFMAAVFDDVDMAHDPDGWTVEATIRSRLA